MDRATLRREGVIIAWLAATTLALTWPLGDLTTPQLPQHDDPLFSVWRLAWVAHQLPHDPAHLFDANIFWPERHTLAYSDAMLLLGVIGAPAIWLGVHPVVVHNVWLLIAFVGAGYAMARLVRHFTPSLPAALVAATIFAYAPYRFAHLGHLELLWTAWLPLALLALLRVVERPTPARGAVLGAVLGLQALSSLYYFVFLAIWLVPAAALGPWMTRITFGRRHFAAAIAALAVTAAMVVPYAQPYVAARAEVGPRAAAEIARYSATPGDYLRAASSHAIYPSGWRDTEDERSLLVGVLPMLLAAAALVMVRRREVAVMAALAVIAFDLSLGVNGLLFPALQTVVPALASFRAPARFGVFVLLIVAVLAAFAVAHLLAGVTRRGAMLVTSAMLTVLSIEFWSPPQVMREMPLTPPEIYAWLAEQPETVTLELPVPSPDRLWGYETTHQYFSIYHWQPLVNGYSGYAPPSYVERLQALASFPSEDAARALVAGGVEIILIHERQLPPGEFDHLFDLCQKSPWIVESRGFEDPQIGRSAMCRLSATPPASSSLKSGADVARPPPG